MNRSARPEYERIRATLEVWLGHYPEKERPDLVSRLRDSNRIGHLSAFFEVALHESLLRLGYEVEVHPVLGHTSKRPDFLVETESGFRFYLEATLADDGALAKSEARLDHLLNQINQQLDNRDFLVGMRLHGEVPTPQPSTRRVVAFLQQRLIGLNPDELLAAKGESLLSNIRWDYDHDGLNAEFFPMPRPKERRGSKPADAVGMHTQAFWADDAGLLYNNLKQKAKYYGDFDLPYVIAINNIHDAVDHLDLALALFGTDRPEELIECFATGHAAPSTTGKGLFSTSEGPKRKHVSAVLHFNGLLPWSTGVARVRLFHNAWAT